MKLMLDIEDPRQLRHYLLETGLVSAAENPDYRILKGGVSCITVLVQRRDDKDFVIKQALSRLRVASRWISSRKRAHREADGMRFIHKLVAQDAVPALLFEDIENHVLAMEAIPQPHENWKLLLLSGTLLDDHAQQFGKLLGTLHANAFRQRDEVEPVFADYSFFESLRLEPYYEFTLSQVPEAADFLAGLLRETRKQRITLVHGDYSPKNVLVYRQKLILLDHETIHWGDPMFDLGFSLTHFLSKANHDPARRAGFGRLALIYWQAYREYAGKGFWDEKCEARAVKHTLACLLARVHGRSPLEYLGPGEQKRQRECVLELVKKPPTSIAALVESFVALV